MKTRNIVKKKQSNVIGYTPILGISWSEIVCNGVSCGTISLKSN